MIMSDKCKSIFIPVDDALIDYAKQRSKEELKEENIKMFKAALKECERLDTEVKKRVSKKSFVEIKA